MRKPPAAQSENLDVLVVDDDEAGLLDLIASLRRAGLSCLGASTGWEALEALLKGPVPSVIVTDIRMPELDGLELAQRLGRMDLARLPELVFISGSADLGHAVDAIRLRARDLLTKPVDLRRLIQIVRDVQLERQAQSLSKATPHRDDMPVHGKPDARMQSKSVDVEAMSIVVLSNLRKLRRVRSENLPAGLAVEASWEILLDLYVSELRSERTSLTALGGSAGVPLTSGLRRIHELESKGMLMRTPDEKDRRRAAAHLTEKGRETVQSFIRSYVTFCRESDSQHADK
ncbi:response regulator [Reyranella sp.]|uniref:response regulator n=1 Tax=Reyranella sp. TaxID=1929291 RepID=UPI00403547E6